MIFGSVCSGIEAASVAWYPLGWRAAFLSEIEPFPRAVLAHHYPDVPVIGDFSCIRPRHLRRLGIPHAIDLLVGGTPCQSFSIAGLRGGMDDARGGLALEFLKFARRFRPRWVVWENVPGVLSSNGGRDFGTFLGGLGQLGYGFAYRVLDAQHFGVPQRRRRVFVVGHLGDWRRAAAVLFERHSLSGNPPPRREKGTGTAVGALAGTSPGGGWRIGADEAAAGQVICASTGQGSAEIGIGIGTTLNCNHEAPYIAHSLRADGFDASEDGTGRGTPLVPIAFDCKAGGKTSFSIGEKAGSLRGEGFGGGHAAAQIGSGVRRLIPRECERLQGFPDDYTLIQYRVKSAADGLRYKALGNSMAVPVMSWIGKRIQAVDSIPHELKKQKARAA